MARTVSTEYVCDNCMHSATRPGPGLSHFPVGWHEIHSFNSTLLVCSLNCLRDVVQHWLDNGVPVERQG